MPNSLDCFQQKNIFLNQVKINSQNNSGYVEEMRLNHKNLPQSNKHALECQKR